MRSKIWKINQFKNSLEYNPNYENSLFHKFKEKFIFIEFDKINKNRINWKLDYSSYKNFIKKLISIDPRFYKEFSRINDWKFIPWSDYKELNNLDINKIENDSKLSLLDYITGITITTNERLIQESSSSSLSFYKSISLNEINKRNKQYFTENEFFEKLKEEEKTLIWKEWYLKLKEIDNDTLNLSWNYLIKLRIQWELNDKWDLDSIWPVYFSKELMRISNLFFEIEEWKKSWSFDKKEYLRRRIDEIDYEFKYNKRKKEEWETWFVWAFISKAWEIKFLTNLEFKGYKKKYWTHFSERNFLNIIKKELWYVKTFDADLD